ncbi:hypothetical protein ACFQ1M_14735 [Sungkyunkwania multivorans]|uniref:Uncharacterized protein n=1 Tax=Sungkyunkwania multivorans TaxID=1173618 RepID=A0ABW3D1L8_9FLAO
MKKKVIVMSLAICCSLSLMSFQNSKDFEIRDNDAVGNINVLDHLEVDSSTGVAPQAAKWKAMAKMVKYVAAAVVAVTLGQEMENNPYQLAELEAKASMRNLDNL